MCNPLTRRLLFFAAILALLGVPASAQQKIGFVDTLQILAQSDEGKTRISEWETAFNAKRQEIESESTELQKLQTQFQQQQLSLNPETQAEMQRSIEEKATKLKRMQEDVSREFKTKRDKIVQEMSLKMQAILEEYGKQNGFSVIFLRNPEQQLFVADSLDVTQEILQIYNERHPAAPAGSGGR